MKLSELKKQNYLKALLVGPPGTGKSVLGVSKAKVGKMRVFDFDGKISSAANFYSDDAKLLDNVEVDNLQANLTDDPIAKFISIIDNELIPQQRAGKMEYDTLLIDSITTFSTLTLKHIVKTNPGIKRPKYKQGTGVSLEDYGILKRSFTEMIPGLLSLPCNIIMTAHITTDKDELTGEIVRSPVMDGKFSAVLGVYFDEVWVLSVDDKGRRIAQTQSNYKFKFCRTQIKGLPPTLDVTQGLSVLDTYL